MIAAGSNSSMTSAFVYLSDGVLVIGNAGLERRFSAVPGQPFVTTAFVNRLTGRDYLRPGGREFAFAADSQPVTGLDFAFERSEVRSAPDRAEAVAHLIGRSFTVEIHVLTYSDHPVVRKWLVVTT